jgi:hypothetical protein
MNRLLLSVGLSACLAAFGSGYVPVNWTQFVKVQGQPEPIPVQWLQDAEARTTHDLRLPAEVPQPVPFHFLSAWWKAWLPGTPSVAVQYFNHLCGSEAGEWIFKKAHNVDGLYFARPQGMPTSDMLADLHGPEMPWIQRTFLLSGDSALSQGSWFIEQPTRNYLFVEQPRREVDWQAGISDPYIRLFGYKREIFVKPGQVVSAWNERAPMQVMGIAQPSARYGYTWRGIRRQRDREHGIAGGEILIYDLRTKEVLAVRRQFLITGRNPRGTQKAAWEVAAKCPHLPTKDNVGLEFNRFAFDVVPSTTPSK